MFELDDARPPVHYGFPRTKGLRAEQGHLAVAVPGAVAGLCGAHAAWGELPLAQVLEPAIAAAEAGVPVTWDLLLALAPRLDDVAGLPHAAAFLLRGGRLPAIAAQHTAGDRLDCSDLAATLRRIAQDGAAGFYEGPVAEAIEQEVTANGGVLTAADLASYRPRVLREPPLSYRGRRYVTCFDQVGYEALNILSRFDLGAAGAGSAAAYHLIAEALACAFADSMTWYGDPDHVDAPVAGLASADFAAARAEGLSVERALPRPVAAADPWPFDPAGPRPEQLPWPHASAAGLGGTSQMVAADAHGNVASLITSLTSSFGSLVLVPGTGVFLNNAMQNFDPRAGRANSIAPGKMPIFAVPTLLAVDDHGDAVAAAGSGGYRIAAGVLQAFVNHVDFGLPLQEAIDLPRVHCQGQETFVDARIPAQVRDRLGELGHDVVVQADDPGLNAFARVAAVTWDASTGELRAAAGPAWASAAGAI
jgi:gamma-glutamyltranspeptidase/glutathione hydrolase